MKAMYRIETFYDRSLRLWTALVKDLDGNQVGDAQYDTREEFAVLDARMVIRDLEYNQSIKEDK